MAHGSTEPQARTFLGGLGKNHKDEEILTAIMAAEETKVIEPKAWIAGYFKQRQKETTSQAGWL